MTLFRQLMLLILILFIFCLTGTLYVTFKQSKDYYQEQLSITAQDTATSLGLSISTHTDDKAVMLSMVNAIFDRGYFTKIEIKSIKGETVIAKTQNPTYNQLPKWFIKLVNFSQPSRTALIMDGWMQKGTLTVISDPSLAYFDLWETTKQLFFWFLLLTILSLTFAYIATKILFKPLIRLAEQAKAVCANVFQVQTKLPKTKELRVVTDAMNRTVNKLETMFKEQTDQINKLRERNYVDPLTRIGNRSFFELKIRHLLSSEEEFEPGHLIFLDITGLKEYNQEAGFEQGDQLVKEVCDTLTAHCANEPLYHVARIAGATLACFLFGKDQAEIKAFCDKLISKLKKQLVSRGELISAHIAASHFTFKQERSELLTNVDTALTQAKHMGPYQFSIFKQEHALKTHSTKDWKDIIHSSLTTQSFEFHTQKVLDKNNKIYHQEVFTKIKHEEKAISAGEFMPVAEKLNLGAELDFQILTSIINKFNSKTKIYSINLSHNLILSASKANEFIAQLSGAQGNLPLHFEIPEQVVIKDLDAVVSFVNMLHGLGYTSGIDRVGANLSPLFYLSKLKCQFLKMDGSLTNDVSRSKDKQFFIRHLKNATNTLGMVLIGTNVEYEEQWKTLQELGIVWGQGRFLHGVTKMD